MRIVEITTFIALSGALHAATLYVAPVPGGSSSGGAGGTADVTLQAATPTLAAMVQEWDRPPEISEAPALAAPEMTLPPERPAQDTSVAERPEPPQQPREIDTAPSAPQVDTTPAARRTAPTASLRPEPRPERPEPARTRPQPAQTAKGAGPQQTASPKPAPKAQAPRGPSQAQLARLEQQWGAGITSALRRAHRPPRGAQGSVTLVIAIAPSGQVAAVSVAVSSGNDRLDQSALAAVKRARFPRAPDGLTQASYRFSQRLTVAR